MIPKVVKNSKVTFQYLGLMSHVFLGSFLKIAQGTMNHYKILEKKLHSCLWCWQNLKHVISVYLVDTYKIWEFPLSVFRNIFVFLSVFWLKFKHHNLAYSVKESLISACCCSQVIANLVRDVATRGVYLMCPATACTPLIHGCIGPFHLSFWLHPAGRLKQLWT